MPFSEQGPEIAGNAAVPSWNAPCWLVGVMEVVKSAARRIGREAAVSTSRMHVLSGNKADLASGVNQHVAEHGRCLVPCISLCQ